MLLISEHEGEALYLMPVITDQSYGQEYHDLVSFREDHPGKAWTLSYVIADADGERVDGLPKGYYLDAEEAIRDIIRHHKNKRNKGTTSLGNVPTGKVFRVMKSENPSMEGSTMLKLSEHRAMALDTRKMHGITFANPDKEQLSRSDRVNILQAGITCSDGETKPKRVYRL